MDMRDVVRAIQSTTAAAAQRQRAFDSATIAAVSDTGKMDIEIAGRATLSKGIGDGSPARWPKAVGGSALVIRMSGQDAGSVAIGPSPFQDGPVTVGEHNFDH